MARLGAKPIWLRQYPLSASPFHSLNERFHQRTTNTAAWGAVSLSPAGLRDHGRTLAERDVAPPTFGQVLRPYPADRRKLLRFYAEAVRIAETRLSHFEHPEVARAVEQELIWALVTCLTNAEPRDESPTMRCCARVLVRLEEVLLARPDRSLLMPEICDAIGISESVLQTCCMELLGMEATRYLYLRSLERVRQALLNAERAGGTEAGVMKLCGFTERHYFMTAYRNAFGQFPHINQQRPSDRRI